MTAYSPTACPRRRGPESEVRKVMRKASSGLKGDTMGKRIEKADAAARKLLTQTLTKWHKELADAEVKVALLLVYPEIDADGDPKGPALKFAGMPVDAKVRLCDARQRLLSRYDAIIEVDGYAWEHFGVEGRVALLDDELEHVVVMVANAQVQRHEDKRPKLKLRPDDYRLSGFYAVADRHRGQSNEVKHLRDLYRKCQLLFGFMADEPPTRKDANAPRLAADA